MEIRFSEDVLKANEAFQMYENGERKKSIELLKHFAAKGNPNSLGNLTWYFALNGDFEKSIDFFNKYSVKMSSWIDQELKNIQETQSIDEDTIRQIKNDFESQISNAKNNVAISFKATGQDSLAKEIWKESSEKHSHREAKFYLLLNEEIQNLNLSQLSNEYGFSMKDIIGLFNDLNSIIEEANGWFNLWARKGLELLNLTREELSICYEISEIISLAKTQEGFFQDYILENFDIATKAATAEAILKGYIKPNEQLVNDLRKILDELKASLENLDNEDNLDDDESDFDDSEDEDD